MAQSVTMVAETLSRLGIKYPTLLFCACANQNENTVFIIDYNLILH